MPERDEPCVSLALPADAVRDDDGTWHVRLPPEHPLFAGHFPGAPILPGIAHIELVVDALAREATRPIHLTSVTEARFLRPVHPNEDFAIKIQYSKGGLRRFELRVGEVVASRGDLSVMEAS